MARRTQSDVLEALPRFKQTQEGVSLVGGPWDIERTNLAQKLTCSVRLAAYTPTEYVRGADGYWNIAIKKVKNSRGKLGRGWEACIYRDGKTADTEVIGRGSDKGWEEPIKTLCYFNVVRAIKKLGAPLYKKENFVPIRPFNVRFPWCDPEEPNAKYSPFTFLGSFYDTETDGVLMYQYVANPKDPLSYELREFLTTRCGGSVNALLSDPDPDGWCNLWHRKNMTLCDRIHIDDWRARLIAGS